MDLKPPSGKPDSAAAKPDDKSTATGTEKPKVEVSQKVKDNNTAALLGGMGRFEDFERPAYSSHNEDRVKREQAAAAKAAKERAEAAAKLSVVSPQAAPPPNNAAADSYQQMSEKLEQQRQELAARAEYDQAISQKGMAISQLAADPDNIFARDELIQANTKLKLPLDHTQ